MKTIKITQNQVTFIDDQDYDWLNQWKWCAQWNKGTQSFYVIRASPRKENEGKQRTIRMHRLILGLDAGDKRQGDHRNHDTLDNQRNNLFIVDHQKNQENRKGPTRHNRSGHMHISWHKNAQKWRVSLTRNGVNIQKRFKNIEDAIHFRDTL